MRGGIMGAMQFYARPGRRLVLQVLTDAFVLAWGVGWYVLGHAVNKTILAVAVPARQSAEQASTLRLQLQDAAGRVATVPFVGGDLRQPFDQMAATLGELAITASDQVANIERTALLVGWALFLVPTLGMIAVWVPLRLRFMFRARQLRAMAGDPAGTDLLALRALTHLSLDDLGAITPDPLAAWRRGDALVLHRLAALELERAGVRTPRVAG